MSSNSRSLRILFFMRNFRGYFRMFEPALRELGRRGHFVHLAYDDKGTAEERRWAQGLAREYPTISFGPTPKRKGSLWHRFGRNVRLAADYLRFLRPEFDAAPDLRQRAARRAPGWLPKLLGLRLLRAPVRLARLTRCLARVEEAIPSGADVEAYLRAQKPDIVLLTPLLTCGSQQHEYLKSARELGLPTMACVASWDNLTSKSLIRPLPDALTVWNETQKREAFEHHGVPPERVVVTGAQGFDHWFDWQARPREAFCRAVGLDPDRPYLFYVCSSLFRHSITEAQFVVRWLRALRASNDPRLREAGVLIRPHPKRGDEWRDVDLSEHANVVVSPRGGAMPVDADAKAHYFDSLFHSVAVVGLNTSAFLEAGIVGRPVYTLQPQEFHGSQDGTLHYRYLMEVAGGMLRNAASLEQHAAQLAELLAAPEVPQRPSKFLEAFLRPNGIGVPASPVFADAVERVAAAGARAHAGASPSLLLLRAGLYPLALRSELSRRLSLAARDTRELVTSPDRGRQLARLLTGRWRRRRRKPVARGGPAAVLAPAAVEDARRRPR